MSKIVVVGANHAGTACINTMLDNFGHENEIVIVVPISRSERERRGKLPTPFYFIGNLLSYVKF